MISVIIPCYNAFDHLNECVRAVLQQQCTVPVEIIVVDSSPNDKIYQHLNRYRGVTVVKSEVRLLPGAARNLGAARASGPLLAFIDVDALLEQGALGHAWNRYYAGAKAFNGSLVRHHRSKPRWGTFLEMGFFFNEFQPSRPPAPRKNLASTILFVERATFLAHSGFKDIPRMQDTEFSERIAAAGVPLQFFPDISAQYLQHTTVTAVIRKVLIQGHNTRSIRGRDRSILTRLLLAPAVPLWGALKVARIFARNIRYCADWREFSMHILSGPAYLSLALVWSYGYGRSLVTAAPVLGRR
jgi:glycosyltransferase involved in cell wall biosynthesis